MSDPPIPSPKRGFTPEEQAKIDAFLKDPGATKGPSPEELARIRQEECLKEAREMSSHMRYKLGFFERKTIDHAENPKAAKEKQKQSHREWYRKKKERKNEPLET